ncbi:MAG: acetyl-CoA carboxylase biotin carboxylase subunit family protein [Burkholderiales bacterium]|jgi:hypothetical protein|nr:ATP-grasp domain-containing protein [Betaproteobacteria bacterium]
MPKVLVLDTNYAAGPIVQSLTEWGFDVWLCGSNPQDALARGIPDRYLQFDYSNSSELLQTVERFKFEYVMPGCNDRSYRACAAIASKVPLFGVDTLHTADTLNSKQKFRDFAKQIGLPVPQRFEVDALPEWLGARVIVKPVDAFSGRGVRVVYSADRPEVESAIKVAQSFSSTGNALVEEYIDGQLFSHSAFLVGGRVVKDFVVAEWGSANPFVVDTSYVVRNFEQTRLDELRGYATRIADVLQLGDGLLHSQFILNDAGIFLVELTRRCPGDLYSELIQTTTGFPYASAYAAPFVERSIEAVSAPDSGALVLRHTLSVKEPVCFKAVSFRRSLAVQKYVQLSRTGDLVRESPFGRIALMLLTAESEDELSALRDRCLSRDLYDVLQ